MCYIIATAEVTTISTTALASSSASSVQAASDSDIATTSVFTEDHNGEWYSGHFIADFTTKHSSVRPMKMPRSRSKTLIIAIGVSTVILLILSSALIITVVILIWSYKRKSVKEEFSTDTSYFTLNREPG